jgi:hypothetical protein
MWPSALSLDQRSKNPGEFGQGNCQAAYGAIQWCPHTHRGPAPIVNDSYTMANAPRCPHTHRGPAPNTRNLFVISPWTQVHNPYSTPDRDTETDLLLLLLLLRRLESTPDGDDEEHDPPPGTSPGCAPPYAPSAKPNGPRSAY